MSKRAHTRVAKDTQRVRTRIEAWSVLVVRPARGAPYVQMALRDFNQMRRQWQKYRQEHVEISHWLKNAAPANFKFRPI